MIKYCQVIAVEFVYTLRTRDDDLSSPTVHQSMLGECNDGVYHE